MKSKTGFSLTELLTAVAIGSIMVLAMVVVLQMINNNFLAERDRLLAEEMANRAQIMFQEYFSQAVNVKFTGNPGGNLGGGAGLIDGGLTNCDSIAACPVWTTVAVFQREIGNPSPDNGSLSKVGVFYRRPEAAPNSPGYIFFKESTANPPLNNPGFSDNYIDRITLLRIVKNVHATLDQVVSLDVTMHFRYGTQPSRGTTWCPELDVGVTPGCLNLPRKDIERRFIVLMRNNLIRDAASASLAATAVDKEERVLGNLYFFHMIFPRN